MSFNLDLWRDRAAARFHDFGDWIARHRAQIAPYSLYGVLCGMSVWPLIEAAQGGQILPVVLALGSVAGGVGGNLLAEQVQRWAGGAARDRVDETAVGGWITQQAPQNPELRQALDQILDRVDALPRVQSALNDTDRAWFQAALLHDLERLGNLDRFQATIAGSGAAAQGEGAQAAGERGVIVNGPVEGKIYTGDINLLAGEMAESFWNRVQPQVSTDDLKRATKQYLAYLLDRYRYLDFKGMGVSDRVPLRLPLIEMYVPLKARIELPEGETWARKLLLAGRPVSKEEAETMGQRLSEPLPVLDLLREHDGLIILGDPGAGKTTFLKYLALCLAQGDDLDLGMRLPVLVPLSAYANALSSRDVPLVRFIAQYYTDRGIDLPLGPMLDAVLELGNALFLLDGLDEVGDLRQRRVVVDRVVDCFAFYRRTGNKCVLSSRIVGYRAVRPTVDGLAECTLVDFEQDEIERFIDRWTIALERAARGDTPVAGQEAKQEKQELLAALQRNPGVRRLAANPLLLTILALMKRQGVTLPERRVELYDKYVETLLKHWNLARGLGRPPARDLDVVETVRVLAPLALWMHEVSPGKGLVNQQAMTRKLIEIYRDRGIDEPEAAARQFLADVREYAGLLLERGPGEYGFIHLTFQEYLAAVAVAQLGQQDVKPVVDALSGHIGESPWHEVTVLAVGYLGIIQKRDLAAGDVIRGLTVCRSGEPGQSIVWAAEAVVDAWPGGVTPHCRDYMRQVLSGAMRADTDVTPGWRSRSGDLLARLGDSRPGVGCISCVLPETELGLPDILWREVPAGPFTMGSKDDSEAYGDEHPQWSPHVAAFKISCYPITQAQYRAFVADDGYREQWKGCWTQSGWQYKARNGWMGPRFYSDSVDLPNHPVVGVSWYEAVAFCRWLTVRLRQAGRLAPDWVVSLPSEVQWEKAARGVDARIYPWGPEPDPNCANYENTGISATNAVGCFPSGASPHGVEELSGNVLEWCCTKWQGSYENYQNDNLPDGNSRRVLRGGAFSRSSRNMRCAYRNYYNPNYGYRRLGFRVVASPVLPR